MSTAVAAPKPRGDPLSSGRTARQQARGYDGALARAGESRAGCRGAARRGLACACSAPAHGARAPRLWQAEMHGTCTCTARMSHVLQRHRKYTTNALRMHYTCTALHIRAPPSTAACCCPASGRCSAACPPAAAAGQQTTRRPAPPLRRRQRAARCRAYSRLRSTRITSRSCSRCCCCCTALCNCSPCSTTRSCSRRATPSGLTSSR